MANFSPGEVLTAANLNNAINGPTINEQTTGAYTLVLADAGKLITMAGTATTTVTIPVEASVDFPLGTAVGVATLGTAVVTIAGASGVTINSTGGTAPALSERYAAAQCYKTAADVWLVVGSLA
jgi:predicted histidine transporter YuiF (NhaC family)